MAGLTPDVRIFDDPEALSHAAANAFVQASVQAVAARGRFLVALSGGSTPIRLYQLLSQLPFSGLIDWKATHVFWGDERCVPVEDLENSYRQVHDILLGRVPIPTANVHRVRSELEPAAAAEDYALLLREYATPPPDWPRFDLVLLGLGSDGHTASLFPGSEIAPLEPVLAVTGHYEDRPAQRVTLGPPVFNAAREVVFLVSGEGKAEVLRQVLYGAARPEALPAQRIHPTDGSLIWMVDRAAASRL